MTQTSIFKYRIKVDAAGWFVAQKRFLWFFWRTLDTRLFEDRAHETIDADRRKLNPRVIWTGN